MRSGHVYCVREKAIRSFNINFTCAHGGGNDCKRHEKSSRHKDYESLKKSQPSCLKFVEAKRGEGQQDIIRAEAMTVRLVSRQDL